MLQVKSAIEPNHLWGIMLTTSSTSLFIIVLNFILNLSLFVQAYNQHRGYHHVSSPMTWSEARSYCREHYTDLATFRDKNEIDALENPCTFQETCWIGLQRDENDPSVWKWSDGEESSFRHWNSKLNQPDDPSANENCATIGSEFWFDVNCDQKKTFLCYEIDLILVKEMKTWEEALQHCRTLDTDPNANNTQLNHLYDLLHMSFEGDILDARKVILDSQTPEVWIGLRFLAGNWLWVNGSPLQKELPACPTPSMYCGTMLKTGGLLQLRDCLERRTFVCSFRNNN